MRFYYEEINNELYFVCQMEEEMINTFSFFMLENNQILGLIKPVYQSFGQCCRLLYNVTNYVTVKDYLKYYNDEKIIANTFECIKSIKASFAAYGINERKCLWDTDKMYINCYTGEMLLICVPLEVYVGGAMPDFKLYANLRECVYGERVESVYPYMDEVDYEGETTVLCVTNEPYITPNQTKPSFKTFKGDQHLKKTDRALRKEARRAKRLEQKQDKRIRKAIEREEGFGFCQIPKLI